MIVGNGLLARSFARLYADRDDVLVFASGVSNSTESDPSAFAREQRILQAALDGGARQLVYFGSCGVAGSAEPPSAYMRHKLAMESLVAARRGGLVLRLPQVVGVTANPNTLTNYLRDKIVCGERFEVWAKAERNLIDIDDVVAIAEVVIAAEHEHPPVVSIAAEHSLPMPAIVAMLERALGRPADCVMVDNGAPLQIDARLTVAIARQLGIDLGNGYAERVIGKYYGTH